MRRTRPLLPLFAVLVFALASASSGQTVQTVPESAAAAGTIFEGSIKGDETVEYVIAGAAGQTLSVDLSASNASLYFNIQREGSTEALFVSSTAGSVADVPLPTAGNYVVQVYLMRNAARRDERTSYSLGIGLAGAADGLAGGPDWWQVSGLAQDALNVRLGPDTRYDVVGKASNGEVMQNRGCRMTGQTRWCSIRVDESGVQGWVAGKYLSEAAAPASPEIPAGGPVGNGTPFDATGIVGCAMKSNEPMGSCPFGVVRDGPGNAGVWIALADGTNGRSCSKAVPRWAPTSPLPSALRKRAMC